MISALFDFIGTILGAVFGLVGSIFGAIFGGIGWIIALPFKILGALGFVALFIPLGLICFGLYMLLRPRL